MTRRFFFFATKKDLLEILTEMEKTTNVQYIKDERYNNPDFIIHKSITEFEDLGISKYGEHGSPMYLVMDPTETIVSEKKQFSTGEIVYHVYPVNNKHSLIFSPGGFYGSELLVHGEVATMNYEDKKTEELYKTFKKAFSKKCKKIHNWYFGKEALSVAKDVRLITVGKNQPKSNDFIID